MFMIGKVTYSQIHSLLPREASLVKIVEEKRFDTYDAAIEYCRKLRIYGDYTFVPVEIPDSMLKSERVEKRVRRLKNRQV